MTYQDAQCVLRGEGSGSSHSPTGCPRVTTPMFTGPCCSWWYLSYNPLYPGSSRKGKYIGWKRNDKNTFIEYLICSRHLTSSHVYLNTQRQVCQVKAILFINDNTVTQIQGCCCCCCCCYYYKTGAFEFYSAMSSSPMDM